MSIVPTWRNINYTPSSASSTGNIAAIKGMSDALSNMNIFKTIEAGRAAQYDTAKAEEEDIFKRESDLLARKRTEQELAKGQFGLDTQQEKFDLGQDATQAQIDAANQRRLAAAFGLKQDQATASREAKNRSDLQKAFRQKMALGDEVFDAEDARTQDQDMLKLLDASPQTAIELLKLEDTLTAPSGAETRASTAFAAEQKRQDKIDQYKAEIKGREDTARIKKKGSNPYSIPQNVLDQMDPDDQIEAQNMANKLFKGKGDYQTSLGKIKKNITPQEFLNSLSGKVTEEYRGSLFDWNQPDISTKDLVDKIYQGK